MPWYNEAKKGTVVRYCVRAIDGRWLADCGGVLHFNTIAEAKFGGMDALRSFVVLEDEEPYRQVSAGLNTGNGFFFLDNALQNRDTSRGPGATGSSPVGADQNLRPLV